MLRWCLCLSDHGFQLCLSFLFFLLRKRCGGKKGSPIAGICLRICDLDLILILVLNGFAFWFWLWFWFWVIIWNWNWQLRPSSFLVFGFWFLFLFLFFVFCFLYFLFCFLVLILVLVCVVSCTLGFGSLPLLLGSVDLGRMGLVPPSSSFPLKPFAVWPGQLHFDWLDTRHQATSRHLPCGFQCSRPASIPTSITRLTGNFVISCKGRLKLSNSSTRAVVWT